MFFVKIIFSTFFIFLSSYSFSQNHNKIEVDLERVKKDIIDLQKFVYQNNSTNTLESNNQDLEQINNQIKLYVQSLGQKVILQLLNWRKHWKMVTNPSVWVKKF